MIVIQSGFREVAAVALGAGGAVAALDGYHPLGPLRGLSYREINELEESGTPLPGTWIAKLWSSPNAVPIGDIDNEEGTPFGLAIDPLDGTLAHGNSRNGLVLAGNLICCSETAGGPTSAFAFAPDGKAFILGCNWWEWRGKTGPSMLVRLVRKKKGKRWSITEEEAQSGEGFLFSHLAYSPDGKRVVVVEYPKQKQGGRVICGDQPTLRVYDAKSLELAASVKADGPVHGLILCGERVVVVSNDLLKVWDSPDLAEEPTTVSLDESAPAVAGDPHGRFLLSASGSSVSVWDPKTWKVAKTYDWKAGAITCLAVAPDGLTAAAGTATGKVVVWDVE